MIPTPSPAPSESAVSWLTPTLSVAILSLILSAIALATSLVFFWTLNIRRGVLRSARPHSFGLHWADGSVSIVLPLVIYNTGAVPIIVQDFRLKIDKTRALFRRQQRQEARYRANHDLQHTNSEAHPTEEPPAAMELTWKGTRKDLGNRGDLILPAVFVVRPRSAETMFLEFEKGGYLLPGRSGEHRAVVEMKLSHRKRWKKLRRGRFDLHLPLPASGYAVHPNRNDFDSGE